MLSLVLLKGGEAFSFGAFLALLRLWALDLLDTSAMSKMQAKTRVALNDGVKAGSARMRLLIIQCFATLSYGVSIARFVCYTIGQYLVALWRIMAVVWLFGGAYAMFVILLPMLVAWRPM